MTKNDRAKIWFTSDTHWGHKNILKYSTNRQDDMGLSFDDPEMILKEK